MSGTSAGALKSWEKRRARGDHLNKEFYRKIGRQSHTGAFGADPEFARRMVKERWRRYRISESMKARPRIA